MTAQDQHSHELLPCPFCGGGVEIEETETTNSHRWWGVVCRNTTSRGGTCAIQQRPSASIEAAVERWNRRAPADQAARALPAGMEPVAWVDMAQWPPIRWPAGSVRADFRDIDGMALFTAAQVQAMGRVPPGWQAVPVEPTIAMLIAGDMPRISTEQTTKNHAAYAAMLAAAPRPLAAQERKPLTDEQIDDLEFDAQGLPNSHLEFARAIEAAHGIT